MITFVCLKAGDAFGPEYVNILFDMISRNLPEGFKCRFVCLTEDAAGLGAGIEIMPLPADLETWWGKLYLFKRGVFPDGERVVFFDLDTLVIGALDEIVKYDGPFATLQDFYYPERVGPAVMLWLAGEYTACIWDAWVKAGQPRHPMGDLWWINQLEQGQFAKHADKLQKLFPGEFVSYKVHCAPYAPKGAAVVCFHGQPKAHNCGQEWVAQIWRVGGLKAAELKAVSNTGYERIAENIRYACTLPVPWLPIVERHDADAVLVGGGPSLEEKLPELMARAYSGATVFATNGAFAYLRSRGLRADYHVIIDSRPENADFIEPDQDVKYLLASQCDRELFDKVGVENLTLLHMNTLGVQQHIAQNAKPLNLISTGTTVGLAVMGAAYCLGFRRMHLYGFDSSFADGKHHAYQQAGNDADKPIEVTAAGRTFKAAAWMVMQTQQFQQIAAELIEEGCVITVAGDGLLPHVAHQMARGSQPEREAA